MKDGMYKKILVCSVSILAATSSYLAFQKYKELRLIAAYEDFFEDQITQELEDQEQAQAEQFLDEIIEQLGQQVAQNQEMVEIKDQDALRVALHEDLAPSVFFFHMDGCGWCKKMTPVFEQVAKNPKFAGLRFFGVDGRSSQAPVVVKEFFNQQITGYPFLLFIDKNGYIDKQSGFADLEKFENKIQGLYPALFPDYVAPKVEKVEQAERPKSACAQRREQAQQHQAPDVAKPDNVIEVNDHDQLLDMLEQNQGQAILFFYMDGCGWCKKMKPVFYEAAQNKDFAAMKFYMINGPRAQGALIMQELFGQQIKGYPFIAFLNQDQITETQSGFADEAKFAVKIKESFAN